MMTFCSLFSALVQVTKQRSNLFSCNQFIFVYSLNYDYFPTIWMTTSIKAKLSPKAVKNLLDLNEFTDKGGWGLMQPFRNQCINGT